jgi:hypothetical protein
MTKRFRPWDPNQKWLLPPEITEFIPEGHPAHFATGRQKHGSEAATHAKNGKPGSL